MRYNEKYSALGKRAIACVCRQLSHAYFNFYNAKVDPSGRNPFLARLATPV
jgi:hypothetical protein